MHEEFGWNDALPLADVLARPRLRLADLTCIRIASGLNCLAPILDACRRKVVDYAIFRDIYTALALALAVL